MQMCEKYYTLSVYNPSLGPGVPDMADKVCLSRHFIGPGPKPGIIASR